MQNIFRKFLIIITLFSSTNVLGTPQEILDHADSLFSTGRYVQAFDAYEVLVETENLASPAMLLKMAFIKEGLGQIDEALYYLNLYYLQTSDKATLRKMEELAVKNKLTGYNTGDVDFFISYYNQYHVQITLVLAALTFLAFAVLIFRKRRGAGRPLTPAIIVLILLALLFYQVNLGADYNKGIIRSEETYVMSGPSAGAKVVDIITAGHRVDMLGQQDVWTKIEWDGQDAYVKDKNIRTIQIF